ncbi:MAG TPA: methyltransferase domain-containing protein [Nocardioidaceae bacterium]|nr:methyltransferase domain-containing protein [Nocardioidaceae bacterium]
MTHSYTHGYTDAVLRVHGWRTVANSAGYLRSHLRPGVDLLDVGCGPGSLTVDLAREIAPGRVVGVDSSAEVLESARAAAAEAAAVDVELRVDDVYHLDLPDDAFDVVHAHQLLQHLADPVAALREMRRVCRPGGVVAARDGDFGTATAHPDVATEWLAVYVPTARALGGEPYAGRHLLRWAHEAGLDEVTSTASAWCFASPDDRAWWGGSWAERVESSTYALEAVRLGLSTSERNAAIGRAWRAWTADPDGWFAITHGEIVARVD